METKTITKQWNEFEDFNVGDVVRLKSGGPSMTIDGTAGSRYDCVWFDGVVGSSEFHRQTFDQGALEKVVAAEQPAA